MDNLIIVGGGPAGLAAAIYASRANLQPLVIEGAVPGGQLTLTSDVENYPGFSKGILGPQLVQEMRLQAERFGTRFVTDNVQKIESVKNAKKVIVSSGAIYSARVILIATGADARWLGLPSEQKLRGKGVSACATCDGFFFKNKVVAVLGGGDSAMEDALVLTRFATKVYVIHRRDTFRASKIMQDRVLKHPKIEVIFNAEVVEIVGEEKVTGVKYRISPARRRGRNIEYRSSNSEKTLEVSGVFVAIGHVPSTQFLKGSGVLLDEQGYILTSAVMSQLKSVEISQSQSKLVENSQNRLKLGNEPIPTSCNQFQPIATSFNKYDFSYSYATSVDGIFAAGDCVDHVYRQAATAVGMGVAAELEIEKYLEK